jgi:protein SCO1/2
MKIALVIALIAALAPAPNPRTIPLIDQQGRPFALADLRGAPVVVTFTATRCRDACPLVNAAFSRLQGDLARAHLRATLVTVTLDPTYDTPAIMARSARAYQADARRWRLASGRPADVQHLIQAFGVRVEPDEHGIPDVHTTFVYVLDSTQRSGRTLLASTALSAEVLPLVASMTRAREATNAMIR